MKKNHIIIASLMLAAGVTSCNDLDQQPIGNTVTDEQKAQVLEVNPGMSLAAVTGIASQLTAFGAVSGGSGSDLQSDIGTPALFIISDLRGQDMYSITSGYNWYNYAQYLSDCNPDSYSTDFMWKYNYNTIHAANSVLKSTMPAIEGGSPSAENYFYAAQSKAFRAYAYFYLAQSYQFTYVGNESAPCVPILTEANEDEAAQNGAPRATVQEVYDQILADLNDAISYLTESGMTPSQVITDKSNRFFSLAAAYGLRARVNLVMNKWSDAAADAQQAIAKFSGRPQSIEEVGTPTFWNANDPNWMLGIAVATTDRVVTTQICNFPSHMGSFSYGYAAAVGAWKWINHNLYETISDTDVRKGWFLDENGMSANLSAAQQAYISGNVESTGADPYGIQVKFGSYQNVLGQTVSASDIPMMRVEEMYLILAEAQGMTSASTGAATLEQFIKTYRDPEYTCTAASSTELQEEVWRQRRIELFGEGFSFFDLMRLKKGIDRIGGGWPEVTVYKVEPQAPIMLLCIPRSETTSNPQIKESDNNHTESMPTPVQG